MKSDNLVKERIGALGYNLNGSEMIVDEYNTGRDIWVKFTKDGNKVHTRWEHFAVGNVRNPYDRTVYGIGYLGEGKYNSGTHGKSTKQYKIWSNMLRRCYNKDYQDKKAPTYKDVTVSEEWHNFQNFAKWHEDNYYEVECEQMDLDKDILVKGNKIYSPETCIFVPKRINNLFLSNKTTDRDLPLGVHPKLKKFVARCQINNVGNSVYLKTFDTPEEAFYAYKTFKEKYIKQIADEYKDKIPSKLYDAMLNYSVEITD